MQTLNSTLRGWSLAGAVVASVACGAATSNGGGGPFKDVPTSDVSTPDGATPDVVLPDGATPDAATADRAPSCTRSSRADLLFVVDNSNSMSENQASLARSFSTFLSALTDGAAGALSDLHVGVISTDLGTPGSVVPSCANTDQGDDGLLNPIRNGAAIRQHYPWTTAPPGRRPMRCTNSPRQFPTFLTFASGTSDAEQFREEFVCNAYLSIGGCGLEQQLESAYRALVVHNPREVAGNTDPNAGFVRDEAVLGVFFVTDEEDTSVRDCRYAERGVPCTDAVSVFDIMSPDWSSNDLNLRGYMYTPGSEEDPTWPIDRYIDPTNPARGFTSLKPGRPGLVIFSAIAGVPIQLPTRAAGGVDWAALLGRNPDGSDGYTAMSAEGPVSMRQRNMDPACSTRVVPACRREGSIQAATCDPAAQYFAWPSRRVAEVVRRFDETYQNGTITSICRNDYSDALLQLVERIQARLPGRCLPRPIETAPAACEPGSGQRDCAQTRCVVREILPAGVSAASACTAARARTVGDRDPASGRDTCVIRQLALPPGGAPPAGRDGFYYDTRPSPEAPDCRQHVEFTAGAQLLAGASGVIECLQVTSERPEFPPAICR